MTKREARKQYQSLRTGLTQTQRKGYSVAIGNRIMSIIDDKMQHIHVYVSIVAKSEVDTLPLVDRLWENRKKVFAPKVSASISMTHHIWTPGTDFTTNKWGIPEPEGETIHPTDLDVVVVPLLAIDQKGHRVGYGKGFYDRFLAQCRADVFTIGVGFFPPLTAIAGIDSYDVALDAYVTQDQTWIFSP